MNTEQLDALITQLEVDLAEFGRQSDGSLAQMQAKLEIEKQKSEQYLNQLIGERNAHATACREDYLRREGELIARRKQRAESAADMALVSSTRAERTG